MVAKPEDIRGYTDLYRAEIEPSMDGVIGYCFILVSLFLIQWSLLNKIGQELFNSQFLLFGAVITNILSSILIWAKNRHVKKFMSDEVGILIAISKLDKDLNEEIDKLHKKLDSLIQRENLNLRTRIITLPERLIPKNEQEAHKIREKKRAQLIIWGEAESGNQNQEKIVKFSNVSFSYRIALPFNRAQRVNRSVSRTISNRQWHILEKDNIIHREYLAKNIEEISLYILGVIFFFQKKDRESFRLLKLLKEKYNLKTTKTTDDKYVEADIKAIGYDIFLNMGSVLEFWPNSKNIAKSKNITLEIIQYCKDFGTEEFSLLSEAQMAFADKEISRAFSLVEKAAILFPNTPSPNLSLAFLHFYQGNLSKGWSCLKSGFSQLDRINTNRNSEAPNIARFYEETLREDPTKKYIYFPLGYIYLNCAELNIAEESFKNFIGNYADTNEKTLKSMLFLSKKFLKKIEKLKLSHHSPNTTSLPT